jgi:hypothetical protein
MLTLRGVNQPVTENSLLNVHKDLPHSGFREELNRVENGEAGGAASRLVRIGTLSKGAPTVSHLLIRHSEYGKNCWKIIHSAENREKPFHRLSKGEDIFVDAETHEIVWGKAAESNIAGPPEPPAETVSAGSAPPPPGEALSGFDARKLPQILEAYIGVPYAKLDCYELLVQGLRRMGVSYGGKEGLKRHLVGKAVEDNLPNNAYLTGGGLIESFSDRVFRKTFTAIGDFQADAGKLYDEIETCLEPGLILSFSTPRRGHTGVVSRSGETWTFLNSGELDNSVRPVSIRKGVGEEALKAEIANWFRRAKDRSEPLEIDIGRLCGKKLAAYMKPAVNAII